MPELALTETDRLFVPHRKRWIASYTVNEDGVRELHIDYGLKEISFDEERLFAFGEQLGEVAWFTGELAAGWGPGYAWSELQPLLEALLDEGILARGDGEEEAPPGGLVASRVPASQCPVLRSWSHAECEAVTRDLSGRAIELGHLEALIPVFRIAHTALDADDRQVGEANVFPPALRLDRETEWRVCQYPGSRYREDLPMNVTALKAMIKHWKPMMTAILAVRDEMIARLGSPRPPWTIGELHTLSCVVLAVPAFVLMQRTEAQPPLHPVLSSLFRITDGIRMVTHDMMFSIEHTQTIDQPLSARALFDYAEKYGAMIGDTGVCAGPNHLIHEFLTTVIDGAAADGVIGRALPAEVDAVIGELPTAFDYGLYGLQAWALVMTTWVSMSRAVEAMRAIVEETHPLADRLATAWDVLTTKQLVTAYERDVHIAAYRDVYERSYQIARRPIGAPTLDAAMAPVAADARHAAAAHALRGALAALPPRIAEPLIDAILTYVRAVQAVLAGAVELQGEINHLLHRAAPRRALSARDLVTVYWIGRPGVFPELFDVLEALDVRIDCTADAIEIAAHPVPAPPPTMSAGVPAGRQ